LIFLHGYGEIASVFLLDRILFLGSFVCFSEKRSMLFIHKLAE